MISGRNRSQLIRLNSLSSKLGKTAQTYSSTGLKYVLFSFIHCIQFKIQIQYMAILLK